MSVPDPRLPRFELVRALGAGGGGRVRLVRDRAQGGALRALKIGGTTAVPDDPTARAALLREARILAALRHPGVPRLFEAGAASDGTPWVLLEFVEAAAADGDAAARALVTARGLLDVLGYLHRHGWLHRDLKPANVIVTAAGRVALVDYGLATREDEDLPARGTLPFVAPEVLAGERADARSDLWSAGATLLALFGRIEVSPSLSIGPDLVANDLPLPADWLRCLLQARPDRRPPTAERALADLDAALGSAATPPRWRTLPRAPEPSGRAAEIEVLLRRMREAAAAASPPLAEGAAPESAAPAPGIVLVRGESGVGKSRLLAELRLRAAGEGWTTISGSCSEQRDAPLPAFGTVLDGALLAAPPDSPAARRRGRSVANLLAARGDDDPSETAARFLVELSTEFRGLVVVVEDLQDASALTLRVLGAIGRALAEASALGAPARLLAVATLTDGAPLSEEVEEGVRSLEVEGLVQTLPLRPLAPDDVARFVSGVLGPRAPADRIADVLRAHGGSLPLFAEELLARLVESGALRADGGAWTLDPRRTPSLPESLTAAIRARLEALPDRERLAVQLLATHELPIPRPRVERMLGKDAQALVASLEAQGLVVTAADGASLAIVHSVVGQAALGLLQPRSRARLHDVVAGSLPRTDPALAVRRAYHVARGSDEDAALVAATDMARRLRDGGESGRAASFVRQAIRLLPDGDPRIPRLRRTLADLLVASGRPEAAANVYRDLLHAETDAASRVKLLAGLADAFDAGGLPAEARQACREALHHFSTLERPDEDMEQARLALLARLAGTQRATGELRESIETVKDALALAGPGQASERASLLSLLGNVYVQMGDLVRARQFHETCLAACRDLGRRRGMATALNNLGVVHARLGQRTEALRCYRQSLRLARRGRDFAAVAQTLGNLGNLRAEEGDFAGAERLHMRSLSVRRRTGDRVGSSVTLGNIAGLLRARGKLGRALALLETAIRRLRAAGDVEGEAQFLLQAATIHLFAGDTLGARPLVGRALDLARGASLRGVEAAGELVQGSLERRADPHGDAFATHLARSQALYDLLGDRPGAAEAWLETALAERDRGRRGSALRAWRQAVALLEGTGAHDVVARAGLVRGRIDADRPAEEATVAGLEAYLAHVEASGRRDLIVAARLALGRARLRAGDAAVARALFAGAQEVEEDLALSLPPGLRRLRDQGPVRKLLGALRQEAENAGPATPPAASGGPDGDDMEQDRLLKLLEINKQLNRAEDMHALLDTIMDVATQATGAERGFLLVVDDQRISFQAARNFRKEEVAKPELKISSSIVRRVLKSGAPILTDNAREDERFAEFKSVERLELKSILSVPFRVGDVVMGALYLDNPARKGAFGPADLQFLSALGDQAALAIRNLRQAEEMAALNRQLASNLATKSAQLEVASRALSERATKHPYDEIIGVSPPIREVLLLLDKVVDTDVPVLVQGESGTGKELIARAIHRYGRRRDGPFVPVNCGAIAETLLESELFGHARGAFTGAVADKKGLFEAAHGGTIFLDEIGEMSGDMQKKLLRVLQEHEVRPVGGKGVVRVDVRVVAATNRDLRKMMQEGRFREDLYYRVAVINLTVPSLRDRAEDIPALIEHFVGRAAKDMGLVEKPFDEDALDAMQAYAWPGNVRELDNEVKKALTLSGDRITLADLSTQIQGAREAPGPEPALVALPEGAKLKESLEKTEKALLEKALERTGGNQTRAARELGISRVWLRKKMEKYGLLPAR